MKTCFFTLRDSPLKTLATRHLGLLVDDAIVDVSAALSALPALQYPLPAYDLMIAYWHAMKPEILQAAKTGAKHHIADIQFLSPIANPGKIIGAPINYNAHIAESKADAGIAHGRDVTTIGEWGLFLKANSSLIGVSDEIKLRFADRRNDHEVELAVVIGRRCNQVKAADAMQYIAGYTIGLDMSLRGKEFQCFRKSIDTYSVLGPWFVTADEISNPDALDLSISVNGELRQKSNTSQMVFSVAKLIEFASSFYTLNPGDVIMTGTPEGVGPVKPGDLLHASVQGLGEFDIRIASDYSR